MPVLAGYALCHAPVLVPEIGKGEEKVCASTLSSYEEIGKEIQALKPETLVLVSPHMECHSDAFLLASGPEGKASFARFRAPSLTFDVAYDEELGREILSEAKKDGLPLYPDPEQGAEFSVDHGSMVPLYFVNRFYRSYRLVRISVSGLPYVEHYRLGKAVQRAIDHLGRKVVFLASGDLSHCQKEDGPYGYKPIGPQYDEKIMKTLGEGDFLGLLSYDPVKVDEAEVCGHPSFSVMAGAFDGTAVTPKVYSHEAPFGVGYGMVSYRPSGRDEKRRFLDRYLEQERKKIQGRKEDPYVLLARSEVEHYVRYGVDALLPPDLPEEMRTKKAGVFVSLHEFGQLRGCIGTTQPTTGSIAEEILRNGAYACSQDPRFNPVREEELPYLEISVDVLSPAVPVLDPYQLNPKKDGLIVVHGEKRGLLLPDLEGVDTVDDQIRICKRKAGLSDYENDLRFFTFTVTRHH